MSAQAPDPGTGLAVNSAPVQTGLLKPAPAMVIGLWVISAVSWIVLAWMALDMNHPVVQRLMPLSSRWSVANLVSIWGMWAVMMAAMMLPSAMPMILTFTRTCARRTERLRASAFVAAYLLVWCGFSVAATAAQWLLQHLGLVNPMIVSTSTLLTGLLLLLAGVYQFSPLKRRCLALCRTPMGFLIGEWRGGALGGLVMGLRHGLFCLGCCWALMALLFVGGVMNLAWIAALSIATAIEKLAPHGEVVARVMGIGLISAGFLRMVTMNG